MTFITMGNRSDDAGGFHCPISGGYLTEPHFTTAGVLTDYILMKLARPHCVNHVVMSLRTRDTNLHSNIITHDEQLSKTGSICYHALELLLI